MAQSRASDSVPPPGKLSPTLTPIGHFTGRPALPISRSVTVIGANKRARLRLLSSSVSQNHALIVNADSGPYIRDLASREHVLVNGERVKESPLNEGDEIQIGRFTFRFSESPHTQLADAVRALRPAPQGHLEVDGEPMPVAIEGKSTLIGRRETCDIPLQEDSASTCHAIVFEMDGKRYVRDLGSRTGTFINGQEIRHQAELHPGDELTIGQTTIRYTADAAPEAESFAPTPGLERTAAPRPAPRSTDSIAPIPLTPTDSSAPIPVEHVDEPPVRHGDHEDHGDLEDHKDHETPDLESAPAGTDALELVHDHPADVEPVDLAPTDLEAPQQPAEEPQHSPNLNFDVESAQPEPAAHAKPGSSNEDFLADLESLAPRAPTARKKNDIDANETAAPLAEPPAEATESYEGAAAPAHAEDQTPPPAEPQPIAAAAVIEAAPPIEAAVAPVETPSIEVPIEHGAELHATRPMRTGLPPGTSQLDLAPIAGDEVNLEADLDEASPADTTALPIEAEAPEPEPLTLSDQVVDFDEEPDTDAIDDVLGLLPEAQAEISPQIQPRTEAPHPEPISEAPTIEESAVETPVSDERAVEEPAIEESAVDEPAIAEAEPPLSEQTPPPHPAPEQIVPARSIVEEAEDDALLIPSAPAPAGETEAPIEGFAFDTPEVAAFEEEVGLSPTLAEQASDDHVTFGGEETPEAAQNSEIFDVAEDGEVLAATTPEPESALPLEHGAAAQEVPDLSSEEELEPSDTGFARAVRDFAGEETGALVEEEAMPVEHPPAPAAEPTVDFEAESAEQAEAPQAIEADQPVESAFEASGETEYPAGASQLDLAPLSPEELQAVPENAVGDETRDKLFDLSAADQRSIAPTASDEDVDLGLELMPEPADSSPATDQADITPEVELIAEPAEEEPAPASHAPAPTDAADDELKLEEPEAPKTAPTTPPPATDEQSASTSPLPAGAEEERFNWGPNQEHFLGGMPLKLGPGSASHAAPQPAIPAASGSQAPPTPPLTPPRPNRQQTPPRPIRRPAAASPFADGRRNTIGAAENRAPLRTGFDGLAFSQPSGRGADVFGQTAMPAGLTAGFDPSVVHDVFGGAATRIGLVTPSDASKGAFPAGAPAPRTTPSGAPGASGAASEDESTQPRASNHPRAGGRYRPPEMPPPAPPVKKRKWFGLRMLLLVLALGGCAGGLWGTYHFVPDHSSVTGQLRFANVDSLSRQRRVDLWKQQQQLLASDSLRTDARARLAAMSAASGGFLDDPGAYGQLAASAVFDPDQCVVMLTSTGGASLADQQRVLALLQAIYSHNQDRVADYHSLQDKAAAVATARDASQKSINELTRQINQLTSAAQSRPSDDEKQQVQAQLKQLSSGYAEAAATVARLSRDPKISPDDPALRQAQKIRDDADSSMQAAQKQLADLDARIDAASSAGEQRSALVARREAAGQSLAQQARTYDMDHQAAQAQAYPVEPTAGDVRIDRKSDPRPQYAAIVCGGILAVFGALGLLSILGSRSRGNSATYAELPDFADATFPAEGRAPHQPFASAAAHEPEPVEV